MSRLVLLQPPAWHGESPLDALARAPGVPVIRFGDLMRSHLRRRTEPGVRAAGIIESGSLFPDELATEVLRDHLHRTAPAEFLLPLYPHNTARALALDELLRELGTPLDAVVCLDLPGEEAERHVLAQAAPRLCRDCAASVDTAAVAAACEVCGGELYQREGDTAEMIRDRFRLHEAAVAPVARHYGRQGLLVTVDAVGTPDEIATLTRTALGVRGR
ncbi:adenylate kinase family protein [Kitasatospora sp. NPDC093550]|uniref:adenylate kinase family protein n=1 Tax=Kitasatospora sp. NPDC093550 TaxID=3364089 RepID=UPI00380B59A1